MGLYLGIREKEMETTITGLYIRFRVYGLGLGCMQGVMEKKMEITKVYCGSKNL